MPRSKQEIREEQERTELADAKEPENIAARALAHRAEKDLSEFWEDLAKGFARLAVQKAQEFLPHVDIKLTEREGFRLKGAARRKESIMDVVLAAVRNSFIQDMKVSADYEVQAKREPEIEEFLIRERIYALVQELLIDQANPKDDIPF